MHSRLLRHFLAVVDHKGMSAAAAELHISQPALTKSIRQLEDTYVRWLRRDAENLRLIFDAADARAASA